MAFHTLIDVGALQELQGRTPLVILDCRFNLMHPEAGRQAYLSGHIPGARYADLNQDLSGPVTAQSGRHPLPAPQALAGRLSAWGIGSDTQVITYDDANGSLAARAWWLLRWLGHGSVAVLDGGLEAWTAAGGALQSGCAAAPGAAAPRAAALGVDSRVGESPALAALGVPTPGVDSPNAAPFTPRIAAHAWLSTDEVLAALRNPDTVLVDARAPERYAGTVEPIDPVAGHVPGALNHPFTGNLGTDGRFLPAAELRRRWLERLAGREPENLVAMCGSGVTACHNLLALEVAGLPGAKLYAGSWSEWIRDPQRPIARG